MKNKHNYLTIILLALTIYVSGQNGVSINTSGALPDNSAILDVSSTNQGFVMPRMTTAQRNSIAAPIEGLQIYNTDSRCYEFYAGGSWSILSCGCQQPDTAGNVTGSATVCQGQNGVNYSVPPITNATGYIWSLPSGATIASGVNTNSISVNFSGSAVSGDITVYGTSTSCGNGVTSSPFAVTVNGVPTNVVATAGDTQLCEGDTLTLTGSATNATSWSWSGPNSFSSSLQNPSIPNVTTAASGTYTLTANNACGSSTPANTAAVTVNANLPASVSIVPSPNDTVCAGESVTFTATPTNGGSTPSYQWKVNSNNVGTDSDNYSTSSLNDGDTVKCIMTSSTCASGSPATSNLIIMTVNANLPASVSIAASDNPACVGMTVTFTATPTNGGTSPSYQWKVNGGNVGTDTSVYSTSSLSDGDDVSCVMTASGCVTGSPATSNTINMTITPSGLGPLSPPSTYNGKTVFTYTGSNQTFDVPNCVTQIYVKLWAAGGGGGEDSQTYGGSGAYAGGYLNVTQGTSLTVIVGGPGTHAQGSAGGFGGGGAAGSSNTGSNGCCWDASGGGGRSAIQFTPGTDVVTAGGGGGSGGIGWNNERPYGGGGGAPDGADGCDGFSGPGGPGRGHGGTTTAGGIPSSGGGGQSVAGSYLTGSAGASSSYYGGGGGGGGYYGGSGGSASTSSSSTIGGGGGGSSYTSNLTSVVNIAGSQGKTGPYTGANSGDVDYAAGVGNGGNVNGNGGPGRVVIYW